MKRYAYIAEGRVRELLYEFTEDFPDTPIRERYTKEFLKNCAIVEDESVNVKEGMNYNSETGEFTEHIDKPVENVEEVEDNGESGTESKWSN